MELVLSKYINNCYVVFTQSNNKTTPSIAGLAASSATNLAGDAVIRNKMASRQNLWVTSAHLLVSTMKITYWFLLCKLFVMQQKVTYYIKPFFLNSCGLATLSMHIYGVIKRKHTVLLNLVDTYCQRPVRCHGCRLNLFNSATGQYYTMNQMSIICICTFNNFVFCSLTTWRLWKITYSIGLLMSFTLLMLLYSWVVFFEVCF